MAARVGGLGIITSYEAETEAIVLGILQAIGMRLVNICVESICESAIKAFLGNLVY